MSVTISGDTGISAVQSGTVLPDDLSTGHPNWDSLGNVGIGTNTPRTTVDVISNQPSSYAKISITIMRK